jgi:hypothetical protein
MVPVVSSDMSGGKMSRRRRKVRRRRELLGGPIPERQLTAADRSDLVKPGSVVAAEDLLLSGYDTLLGAPLALPVEITPLYAMLAVAYHATGRRASYPVVVASSQMVRGLEYLGLEAELIPASTKTFSLDRESPERPTMKDGNTDEHLVVWAASFNRCIDLVVCQDRTSAGGTVGVERSVAPVAILPIPGGREQLLCEYLPVVALRPPLVISWTFFPERLARFEPLLSPHAAVIEHGGLAMAHATVDLLGAFAIYLDLSSFNDFYPRLSGLLSGATRLPELNHFV